jgi:hypothetical protein
VLYGSAGSDSARRLAEQVIAEVAPGYVIDNHVLLDGGLAAEFEQSWMDDAVDSPLEVAH